MSYFSGLWSMADERPFEAGAADVTDALAVAVTGADVADAIAAAGVGAETAAAILEGARLDKDSPWCC